MRLSTVCGAKMRSVLMLMYTDGTTIARA